MSLKKEVIINIQDFCAKEILEEVEFIYAFVLTGEISNMFRKSNYFRNIDLLKDEIFKYES